MLYITIIERITKSCFLQLTHKNYHTKSYNSAKCRLKYCCCKQWAIASATIEGVMRFL